MSNEPIAESLLKRHPGLERFVDWLLSSCRAGRGSSVLNPNASSMGSSDRDGSQYRQRAVSIACERHAPTGAAARGDRF